METLSNFENNGMSYSKSSHGAYLGGSLIALHRLTTQSMLYFEVEPAEELFIYDNGPILSCFASSDVLHFWINNSCPIYWKMKTLFMTHGWIATFVYAIFQHSINSPVCICRSGHEMLPSVWFVIRIIYPNWQQIACWFKSKRQTGLVEETLVPFRVIPSLFLPTWSFTWPVINTT